MTEEHRALVHYRLGEARETLVVQIEELLEAAGHFITEAERLSQQLLAL